MQYKDLYRSGPITTVVRELVRYVLDLIGVQEVRWDKEGTVGEGHYIFLCKRKRKSSIANRIFLHHRTVSTVKTVEFVSDRVS